MPEPEDKQLSTVDEFIADGMEITETDLQRIEENGLAEWFLGELAMQDALEEKIKAQYKVLLAQVEASRKAIWWVYGQDFQIEVNRDIQAADGKKKSKDYFTGRAGFRTTGGKSKAVVTDEVQAMASAEILCPDAIKRSLKPSVLAEYAKDGEPLPGTTIETTPQVESFYPARPSGLELKGTDDGGSTDD